MNRRGSAPPLPPREPEAADCCGEGCVNCVFDVYEAKLARYRAALDAWRREQEAGGSEGEADPGRPAT